MGHSMVRFLRVLICLLKTNLEIANETYHVFPLSLYFIIKSLLYQKTGPLHVRSCRKGDSSADKSTLIPPLSVYSHALQQAYMYMGKTPCQSAKAKI